MADLLRPKFGRQRPNAPKPLDRHPAGKTAHTYQPSSQPCTGPSCGTGSGQQGTYTLQFCPDCIWAGLIALGVNLALGFPFGLIAGAAYLFRRHWL